MADGAAPVSAPPGAVVQTVIGPIPAADLGIVLPREHVLADLSTPTDTDDGWRAIGRTRPPNTVGRVRYETPLTMDLLGEVAMGAPNRDNWQLTDRALAADELRLFRASGGGTVVDVTTAGRGRDPQGLRQLAEATGVHLVIGAGWYHPAWESECRDADPGLLTDRIAEEILHGADGVRAGVIGEIGPLDPDVPDERNLLIAAGRAAARTGAGIVMDRLADPSAQRRALDVLEQEGADLGRIAVGGCDGLAPRPEELAPLLERGVFVLFDGLGRLPTVRSDHDDQDVAAAVVQLAGRGHGHQLLLSQQVDAKARLTAYGAGGYAFIATQFRMLLSMLGGDDALFTAMTTTNPARLLALTDGAP